MSDSLRIRWILNYFTEIAQTYGGNLLNVPEFAKKQRVQITQFLTFPRDDHPDDIIWARVSDKEFSVPVKFTCKAVSEYNRTKNIVADQTFRLTKRRYALASLGQFRPFFARIPLANGRGLDTVERLALEVNFVNVIGADGEGIFGDPRDLETNEDMKAWCEGLREGGDGGNFLKVAKEIVKNRLERARSLAEASPVPEKGNVSVQTKTSESEPRPPDVHAQHKNGNEVFPAKQEEASLVHQQLQANQKPQREVDLLTAWKKSWRTMDYVWPYIVDIPDEVQLEHMQVLKFGQGIKGGHGESLPDKSILEDSIDELEREEQKRSQEIEADAVRRDIPERIVKGSQTAESSLPSPKPTPVKDSNVEKPSQPSPRTGPTTPSVWASSDDGDESDVEMELAPLKEREMQKEEENAPERTLDNGAKSKVEPDDSGAQDLQAEDAENKGSQAQPSQSQSISLQFSPKSQAESHDSPKEPTPAQRHVQGSTKPLFPFHRGARRSAPPDSSQSYRQSQSHSQSSRSDSGIVQDLLTSFDPSQAQRYGVGRLALANVQNFPFLGVPHTDSRKEVPGNERGPPKVLVPDSDVSRGTSQLGHSHSQSQSQFQSQSQKPSQWQSQGDSARSQPLLPSQAPNIAVPNSLPQPVVQSAPGTGRHGAEQLSNRQTAAPRVQGTASQSKRSSSSDPASKENANNQKQGKAAARSQSTSQTQTDSQQSVNDPFVFSQAPKALDNEPQCIQPAKGQPTATAHKDSQRIQSRSSEPEGNVEGPVEGLHEKEAEMNEMDVDDARTHAMLLTSMNRRLDRDAKTAESVLSKGSSKDKQFTIKGLVGSPRSSHDEQSASKLSSLGSSPPQTSPSAHLGKRPRSSSISIQRSSSPRLGQAQKGDDTISNGLQRKKARQSPHADEYVVQRVKHEPQAWREASFLTTQALGQSRKETEASSSAPRRPLQVKESRAATSSRMAANPSKLSGHSAPGRKASSTDQVLKSRSRTSASSSSSIPNSKTSLQGSSDSRPGPSLSRAVDGPSTAPARKLLRPQNPEREAAPTTNMLPRGKIGMTIAKAPIQRPDFTLRREPGGPNWSNWHDMQGILLRAGRLRYKEAQAQKSIDD